MIKMKQILDESGPVNVVTAGPDMIMKLKPNTKIVDSKGKEMNKKYVTFEQGYAFEDGGIITIRSYNMIDRKVTELILPKQDAKIIKKLL